MASFADLSQDDDSLAFLQQQHEVESPSQVVAQLQKMANSSSSSQHRNNEISINNNNNNNKQTTSAALHHQRPPRSIVTHQSSSSSTWKRRSNIIQSSSSSSPVHSRNNSGSNGTSCTRADDYDDSLLLISIDDDPADNGFCQSGTIEIYDDDEEEDGCCYLDDSNSSTSEESDVEAFLEYARDVVEYNNAPYDPQSFHDFEQLLGDCLAKCFTNKTDDEQEQDSLASDKELSSYSGYDHESGTLSFHQKQLLKTPLISELAAHRIKGMIATKKMEVSQQQRGLTTINGSFVPTTSNATNGAMTSNNIEADSSDDSIVAATGAVSLNDLRDSIVARALNKSRRSRPEGGQGISDDDDDSESASNDKPTRRKRPKCRRMRKTRSEKRDLPPRNRPSKDIRSTRCGERSAERSPQTSETSISALLSGSPVDKDKVLRYLKQYSPQLYKSVVDRMDREGQMAGMQQVERGYHNDSGFLCTPEKPAPRNPPRVVACTSNARSDSDPRLPPIFAVEVSTWKPCIDTASVIKPSIIKAGVTFSAVGSSSDILRDMNHQDHVTVSLTEDIELVLHGMLQKQVQMKCQPTYMHPTRKDTQESHDMAIRGMALIHKFRAKRIANLANRFGDCDNPGMGALSHTENPYQTNQGNGKTASVVTPSTPSPQNSTNSELLVEESTSTRSPQQLDPYMDQAVSSMSSKSSPTSSLEEQRQKLRRLKEKRRRNMPTFFERQESRENLLQNETSPKSPKIIVLRQKSSGSSDVLSTMSKASTFRHIKFPLQKHKKKDSNYEALGLESSRQSAMKTDVGDSAGDCSPLLKEISSRSSVPSSTGHHTKNNSFFLGGLKSDDLNKIMIDPQSPECHSPIRVYRSYDLSDHSRSVDTEQSCGFPIFPSRGIICDLSDISSRVPTIFEDNNSSTGYERLESSTRDTSTWSEVTFQSDLLKFPVPSTRKYPFKPSTAMETIKGLSIEAISERIEEVVMAESIDVCTEFNDSFDEIVSRDTPSHHSRLDFDEKVEKVSPVGVMDVVFQSQMHCKEKSDFLAFADNDEEEEADILFTDKEDSFQMPFIEAPVFLTPNRFEI